MSEPWGMLDEAELPARYGQDLVHAMARDPRQLFVYWELTEAGRGTAAGALPAGARASARMALRLSALGDDPKGTTQHELVLIVDEELSSAYIDWERPGWVRAEIGVVAQGIFVAAAVSPPAPVPPALPATTTVRPSSPWRRREGATP